MRALQSFRRSHLGFSSSRIVSVPQCCPRRAPASRWQGTQFRRQHDNSGPHKEYFQTPGKEPKPDLTPYIREPQHASQSQSQSQPPTHSSPASSHRQAGQETRRQDPQTEPGRWLRVPRVIRSAMWFVLFFTLGWTAGTALITWEYLSPAFEPGSPEEQELVEEILETLDSYPVVQEMRDHDWVEVEPFTPDPKLGLKGHHMVHQVLGPNNTQGVFIKVFHNPTAELTMFVFFLGFGVEGWPDVIHGGLTSTLLQEAVSKHIAYFHPDHHTTAEFRTDINFHKPCRPGDVYGIMVGDEDIRTTKLGNVHVTALRLISMLFPLNELPGMKGEDVQVDAKGDLVTVGRFTTKKRQAMRHASCIADVTLIPKKFEQTADTFQVGVKDDEGFANALSILKTWPEFKTAQQKPEADEEKDKD